MLSFARIGLISISKTPLKLAALFGFVVHHSEDEDREITIGYSARQRLLFVSHCRRGDRHRIISARKATRRERQQHEEGIREEKA